jgi:hypothetical protein
MAWRQDLRARIASRRASSRSMRGSRNPALLRRLKNSARRSLATAHRANSRFTGISTGNTGPPRSSFNTHPESETRRRSAPICFGGSTAGSFQSPFEVTYSIAEVLNQRGSTTIGQHAYTLDAVGNRSELAERLAPLGGGAPLQQSFTFAYDHLYRLTGTSGASGVGPQVSNIVTTGVTSGTISVDWQTAVPSTAQVQFGTSSALGSSSGLDSTLVTTHRVTLSGLMPATTSSFAVVSRDASGVQTTSQTFTFTTLPTAVLGQQTLKDSLDTNPIGLAETFPVTATSSGPINRLFVYLDPSSEGCTFAIGLYADSGSNHPGTLLTSGSIATNASASGGWNVVTVPSVNLTAGTRYWATILNLPNSGNIQFRAHSGGPTAHSETSSQTNLTALPTTWSTGQTWATGPVSAFAANVSDASLDLQPPALAITSHTHNQTVSGSAVTLTASATDGVGVAAVQLWSITYPLERLTPAHHSAPRGTRRNCPTADTRSTHVRRTPPAT